MDLPQPSAGTYAPGARYGAAIFLGAFLLFLVQPLLARAVLPWFGGAPAVWTTCLLFFQVLLFGGYLYAHLLSSRLSLRRQALVHCALLLASLLFLDVLPAARWRPAGAEQPVWRILAMLAASAGAPYLLLASTSPLLQAWFRRAVPGASPYRLYSLSNAGSLLALLGYPFVLEPLLALKGQALLWGGLYVLFALACGWCALPLLRGAGAAAAAEPARPAVKTSAGELMVWLLLAACGSALLTSVTAQLTQNLAAAPLLWVAPLALYLLSFILCFEGDRWYDPRSWTVLLVVACAGAAWLPWAGVDVPLALQAVMYCLSLFIGCMFCHGSLAARRPEPGRLTVFYLAVAAGGALGGLLAAVGAPLLLDGPWEYHLAWLAAASLALWLLASGGNGLLRSPRGAAAWCLLLGLYGVLTYSLYAHYKSETAVSLARERNFYGTLNVFEADCGGTPVLTLMNGQIEHGFQFPEGDERRRRPVSYYGPASGVGVALETLRELSPRKKPLSVGVVGLGAGVMAAWGRPGDSLVFYEINPLSARLAREMFTYLEDTPAGTKVVLGDARLSLEREAAAGAPPLDLLVLDAFTGDAIPLHLLTKEAFAVYFRRLRPGGVLALHISNRFVDLQPLARGLTAAAGKRAALVEGAEDEASGAAGSDWVLVTDDPAFIRHPGVAAAVSPWRTRGKLVFTDQYANLLTLIRRDISLFVD